MPSFFRLPRNEAIFCQETGTGNDLPGILEFGKDQVSARFHSPSGVDLCLQKQQLLPLVTQQGLHVTLLVADVDEGRTEPHEDFIDIPDFRVVSVRAHLAVIGQSPWTASDDERASVKEIWFSIPFLSGAFTNNESTKRLLSELEDDSQEFLSPDAILTVERPNDVIYFSHQVFSRTGVLPKCMIAGLVCKIKYSRGAKLQDAAQTVNYIQGFLALLWGVGVRPTEIRFRCLEADDGGARCTENQGGRNYQFMFPGDSHEQAEQEVKFDTVYRTENDAERGWFEKGIEAWIAGSSISVEENGLLMNYWRNKEGAQPGHNLLRGHSWLGAMPDARMDPCFSSADRKLLMERFDKAFLDFPNDDLRKRAQNALMNLDREGTKKKIMRLAESVRSFLPDSLDREMFVQDLKNSWKLRGNVAHNRLRLTTKPDHENYERAGSALEALCVLLSLSRLPMPDDWRARIRAHPSISEYLDLQRVSRT